MLGMFVIYNCIVTDFNLIHVLVLHVLHVLHVFHVCDDVEAKNKLQYKETFLVIPYPSTGFHFLLFY